MNWALHIATVVLLATGTFGCGDLANAPFLLGTVHGQLSESDPSMAYVSALGSPDVRCNVAPDGTFTLEHVPAGAAELFIVASANKALRTSLVVQGGQSVTLGTLEPNEAGFMTVRVKAPAHQSFSSAKVTLLGTPLQQLPLDATGRLILGPLPDGCYTLGVSLPGSSDVSLETCLSAGERKDVKVTLPKPDHGCSMTGCSDGFHCSDQDQCVECIEDVHCGAGLSCRNFRCEGKMICATCEEDEECLSAATCQKLPNGDKACLTTCSNSERCDNGFTCQSGQCLPNLDQFTGCGAYRAMGTACSNQDSCRNLGLVNGLCIEGLCTVQCTSKKECPASYECEDEDDNARMCTPDL